MDILELSLFVLSVFLLIFVCQNFKKSFGALYIIIVFSYIITTRSDTVPDTRMYLKYFYQEDSNLTIYQYFTTFEYGFRFFTKLIKSFTEDNEIYLACICVFNMLLITYSSKRLIKNYNIEWGTENDKKIIYYSSLFLLLYIAYFGIYVNAVVLRVGMAYSILYYAASVATDPIKKKYSKYITIILLFVLANLVHSSSVFGGVILLVLLFSKKIKKEVHIGILIAVFFIYFLNLSGSLGLYLFKFLGASGIESTFLTKLATYNSGFGTFESEGFSLKFLFFWSMCFISALNRDENQLYYKLLNVLTIGVLIHAVFRSALLVERITDYFTFYSFSLFYLLLNKKTNFAFWIPLLIIICIQMIFALRITNLNSAF